MLIVMLAISIIIGVGGGALGIWISRKNSECNAGTVIFSICSVLGTIMFIGVLLAIIWHVFQVQESFVVQDRIDMYQEQNDKIESDMSEMVQSYMQYEGQTFKEVTNDNAMQLVQLYPNLKSNELVVNNMNLHQENIKTINKLKDEQIHYKIARWWLYFGN